MNKEDYIKIASDRLNGNSKEIMIKQINNYYKSKEIKIPRHHYNIGDDVYLKKGTLLHGTYQNMNGLESIVKDGLISTLFVSTGRFGKYPGCVGVWNLRKDYKLVDYIDFYSGGCFKGRGYENNFTKEIVLSYTELNNNLSKYIRDKRIFSWDITQTKESRFMPNMSQDIVQIGIIFNSDNKYIKALLKYDILDKKNINDKDVEPFVNPEYYDNFIKDRLHKNMYFTDRESAILFGIPAIFIEGILVGRKYEKNKKMLNRIKKLLPNCYICNLEGKVIVE